MRTELKKRKKLQISRESWIDTEIEMEAAVDCKHGTLTGVDVHPANEKESLLVSRHLERQVNLGVPISALLSSGGQRLYTLFQTAKLFWAGIRRRVLASSCYPAFFRGHLRAGTHEYLSMMRLRKIWAEGAVSPS